MTVEISPAIAERLNKEMIVWITTVNANGIPQPTPVWFLWDNGRILVMSGAEAKKVRNLRQNPHVALNFNSDALAQNGVTVITGTAQVENAIVPPALLEKYFAKYGEQIKGIGMTNEVMAKQFSAQIYITPEHVRAEA